MRRAWSSDIRFQNDFCGARGFAVEFAIRVLIGTKRRAIERYAGKHAPSAGVAQNLRAHISVCVGWMMGVIFNDGSVFSKRFLFVCSLAGFFRRKRGPKRGGSRH